MQRARDLLLRCLWLLPFFALGGVQAASYPPGFSEQEIPRPDGAATWNEAVGMTFQSTGRLWVWERGGRVWIVDDASPVPNAILDISPEVGSWGDHGMLGFALHPAFETNGYIYLLYVVDRHHLMNCDSPANGPPVCSGSYNPNTDDYNSATIGRVVRYRMVKPAGQSDYTNAKVVDLTTRRTLIGETLRTQPKSTGCPILHTSHGVGTLAFGMDGTLLVSCGDGASFTSTDSGSASETYYSQALADGIIRTAENVGAFRAQIVNSHNGKILRIDPDTGDGILSNPFYNPAAPRSAASRVWSLGIRNGFRFSVRPLSGSHDPAAANPGVLYVGDVGWATWEDLNVVRSPGENLGWPLYEGMTAQPSYTAADPDNLDAPNPLFGTGGCTVHWFTFNTLLKQETTGAPSWPNPCNASQQITSADVFMHTRPALDWRHGSAQSRFAGFDLSGNAVAQPLGTTAPNGYNVDGTAFSGSSSQGGIWYTGTDFPVEYRNTYFHGDYSGQWIRNFVFDSNNVLQEVRNFMTAGGGVVEIATHPITGALYYNAWTAFVRKVTFSPTGNVPPVAQVTAAPTFGATPLNVQFDASGSTDANGTALTYTWNFGDGSPAGSGVSPTHTYTAPAGVVTNFNATVTARDPGNLTSQKSVLISVNNTPPTVNITSPVDGTQYPLNSGNINVPLTATMSDAQTPTNNLACQWLVVLHHNSHTHENPPVFSCSTNFLLAPVGCDGETYYYRFQLTVTDSNGISTVKESRMYPACGGGTPDVLPPSVPQNLTAQATSATDVALNWSASTDNGGGSVAGYRIYRNGIALNTAAGTSFTDSTASPNTTYTYRVSALDNANPSNESAQSNQVQVTTPNPAITIRVNTGGPAYTDSLGRVWSADFGFTGGSLVAVSNPINGTPDPALYQKDRWDPPSAPEMSYAFTVPNGSYTVKLHFVEHWSGGQAVGRRIFDVLLENQLALDNLDIFAQAGGYTLLVKTLQTTVNDGQLNINFVHGSADDPLIGAIEITSAGGPPPADTQPPTVPQNLTGQAVNATSVSLSWNASTDNGGGTVAGYRVYRNGVALNTTVGTTYTDNTVVGSTAYTYRVAAYDNASPANESAQSNQISVTTPAPTQTVIRVNAGGPQYTDSAAQVWAADFGFNTGSLSSVGNAIAGTSDPALYQKERWDPPTGPELAYAFTVPNGNYTVKLHFAETWSGGQAVGRRIFDVSLENQLVLDNLDIFAQVGGYTALIKTFQTTVSDGQLNINFAHGSADDPTIGAIEIISGGGPPPADTQPPTVPQNLTGQAVSASQVTLSWNASTDNGGGSVAGYRVYRNGTAIGTSATTGFTDNGAAPATTYTYRVTAYDNASPANESAQSNQISVTTPAAPPATVIRVNTGGPQYTDSAARVWSADFGFTGGSIVTVSNPIAGTSDPALYQKDRWDPPSAPEMSYAFNVPNGSYTVKLHFVEHWSGGQAVGRRIFDVFLENALVLDNLDIFAQVGGYTLLVKTFTTTVSDGQLNINFVHGSADDPIIGAIEILSQ